VNCDGHFGVRAREIAIYQDQGKNGLGATPCMPQLLGGIEISEAAPK